MTSPNQPGPEPRDHVRFLLGDELVELRGFAPTLTVLDWLRGAARLSGCAWGHRL